MYAKGKGSTVPSDAQAREKLALYVYEYLLHVGAQKSAQTFLSEFPMVAPYSDAEASIRWEKNITLGEPPGFLHSWWCVFWDLYCAAPERRETCDHSSEAKAFHDYGFVNSGYGVNGLHNPSAPSPLGQMPPQDGMPGGPGMPPGFFPNSHMRPSPPQPHHPGVSQPSPHPQQPPTPTQMMAQNQPFMSPRYPGGPRGPVRMPNQVDFNGPGGGQMPGMPNNMDMRPGHPGPLNPGMRMNHPRMPGPMNPGYGGMRGPPPGSMGPGGPVPGGMPPMSMQGGQPGNRPWPPSSSTMNYSSPSPGNFNGPPATGPPGTPIMPSPQGSSGPYSPASHRLPRRDSNSGDTNMYGMMKPQGMPGSMPGFPMGGPDGMGPMGPGDMPPVMNGEGMHDGMKNSPHNGPGTPRDDMPPVSGADMAGYNLPYQDGPVNPNDHNESAAILKIKESMQEEAKRFEKDTPGDPHGEYFMQ